jgi:hypothetical protein
VTGREPVVGDRVQVTGWDRPSRGARPPVGATATVLTVYGPDDTNRYVWWGVIDIPGRGRSPVRRDEIEKEDDQ